MPFTKSVTAPGKIVLLVMGAVIGAIAAAGQTETTLYDFNQTKVTNTNDGAGPVRNVVV